jgi:hypothetical protein
MSRYEVLEAAEGVKYMPKVWNLHFKPLNEDNYFVEPWKNTALADCAEFRLSASNGGRSEVLFFVKDPELVDFLARSQEELYMYGAYNQINVCQMRAKGSVAKLDTYPEADSIKQHLRDRIASRVGAFVSKLSQDEANERYTILDQGQMFCFRPTEYAYGMYERG